MTGRKLKINFFSIVFMMFFLFVEGVALAKTPEFRLDMDSLNLQTGTSTNMVLTVSNADGAEVVEVKGLENFDVVSKGSSTSARVINGDVTKAVGYTYVIMPKSTGKFTLQGIVKYNGTTYQTNELQVSVGQSNNTTGEAKDIFVKTLISSNEVYFGQKVVLSYELYSRYNIEDFGFLDSVNISDFIGKDIPQDKLKAQYVYIDGNKYVKYEAMQRFLLPIKAGKFSIPTYNFQANVSTGGGFFDSAKPVYLKTNPVEITVKPLPQDNKPSDFSGIVGKLNVESKYSRQEVNYGDSITLQITASGNCNLDTVKKIVKDDIPGFSVYQTEKSISESVENNQYNVKKEFEVILVPSKGGDIKIDPMYISFFNTETGRYDKAEISGTTIKVNGEASHAQTGKQNSAPKVETVKISQVDYKPLNEGYLTIQFKKVHLLIGLAVLVLLIITGVLFLLMLSFRKRQDKHLQTIYKQIRNTDNENEIFNHFNNMMKHCFNLSLKANSMNDIKNRLAGNKIVEPVLEIMSYMENGKNNSGTNGVFLKDKIKEIYVVLQKGT